MSTAEDKSILTTLPEASASGITPMLAQYIDVKTAHPDSLLFYRMGDFYELFFGDAVEAARALDITLTRRGKVDGRDVPMCGVPFHAAEAYLSRLIRQGFRVAICEQSENPETAKKRGNKGPLKRDVVRIVTPGTLVEDEFLPPRENNFLAALGEAGGASSLAWVDLSTGEIMVESIDGDRLEESLARLQAAEIIVSDRPEADHPFTDGETHGLAGCVSIRPARDFDSTAGERRLCEVYGVSTLDGMAMLTRSDCAAAGALVRYLDQTQKGRALRFRPIRKRASAGILEMDPASRRSLEITRTLAGKTQGSLLSAIDDTATAAGARLLAARIAAPLTDPDAINSRLDLVEVLKSDPVFRDGAAAALKVMPDLERALSRLGLGHGGPRDIDAIGRGIGQAQLLAEAIDRRVSTLIAAEPLEQMAVSFRAPAALADQISTTLGEHLPLLARDGGYIRPGFHAGLDDLRALRDESKRLIAGLQAKYCETTGISSLKIKHNNVLGYHIEVRSTHADAMLADERFIHRQTTAQALRFSTTELAELEREMSGAADRALAVELELFSALADDVLASADAIRALAHDAARLDVAAASARLAERWNYCRPELDTSTEFHIQNGRHPVVEQMLGKMDDHPFIANTCHLSAADRIWLLTGPNMAGKSTFLRQNALIAVMAQAGFYVPAESAVIGMVDRLFCRVGASDDLATGRSTFMVEMVETAAILNRTGERSLVILDEIGRGTATYDGLSLAWAVVEYLHEVNRCRTLFATHYHELNALERSLEALSTHAMTVREWQGDIVFLHEVAPGGADRSYGIHVARIAGIPAPVLERAEAVLESLTEENAPLSASAVDDLPLFSIETRDPPTARHREETEAVLTYLDELLPDTMTPLEALEALYALKKYRDQSG
ncbi:DNA mismatch repair protein MutS [Alphaproteobacteria bacterium LSUCC0684]